MNVANISAESSSKVFLRSNIVTGVIENQTILATFIAALQSNGVMVIEILQGSDGLSFLEQQENSIRGLVDFFMGDMETDMRRLYASEIRLGRIVFGIPVSSNDRERVIGIARDHHASAIAYFGKFIVENIEGSPAEANANMTLIAQASSGESL